MRNPSSPTVARIAILPLRTAAPCGGGTSGIVQNRNHRPHSTRIKTATGLVTRVAIEIVIGTVTGPKRETSVMVQNGPLNALHDTRTTTVSTAVLTSMNVHVDMMVLLTAKQSRGVGPAPVHHAAAGGHTPPNIDLCHLHPCRIQYL